MFFSNKQKGEKLKNPEISQKKEPLVVLACLQDTFRLSLNLGRKHFFRMNLNLHHFACFIWAFCLLL